MQVICEICEITDDIKMEGKFLLISVGGGGLD
jgi:hypothetical protein